VDGGMDGWMGTDRRTDKACSTRLDVRAVRLSPSQIDGWTADGINRSRRMRRRYLRLHTMDGRTEGRTDGGLAAGPALRSLLFIPSSTAPRTQSCSASSYVDTPATRKGRMRCGAMRCDAMRCDAMRCDARVRGGRAGGRAAVPRIAAADRRVASHFPRISAGGIRHRAREGEGPHMWEGGVFEALRPPGVTSTLFPSCALADCGCCTRPHASPSLSFSLSLSVSLCLSLSLSVSLSLAVSLSLCVSPSVSPSPPPPLSLPRRSHVDASGPRRC